MALIFMPPNPAKSGDDGGPPVPGVPDSGGQHDATLVGQQDPASFLGIVYSYSTGAPGSAPPGGQAAGAEDPTNMPNQYPGTEPISGIGLDSTGAPGTQGAPMSVSAGGESMLVTDPNYTSGRPGGGSGVQMLPVPVQLGGPADSTMVQGQYPPAAPIVPGPFYPTSDGAGHGSVLVGGFKKGARPGPGPATTFVTS